MANSDNVSHEEFELAVSVLTLQLQKTQEIVFAVLMALASKSGVTLEEVQAAMKRTQNTKTAEKLHDVLQKLQRFASIRNVLRDFEGPLQ